MCPISVVDLAGELHFTVSPTELEDGSLRLVDGRGRAVASCRRERFGPGTQANIIVKNGNKRIPSVSEHSPCCSSCCSSCCQYIYLI